MLAEPDVLCDFSGSKWGIACKLLYSLDRDHQIDRIVEGAKQIEACGADIGMVAVNVTNLISHDRYFGPMPGNPGRFFSFKEPKRAIEMLASDLQAIIDGLNHPKLMRRLSQGKQGELRVKTRAVIFFVQTAALVRGILTPLAIANWYRFREIIVGEEFFLPAFDDAAQTVVTHRIN
jgi:hypothetical protein